jgi:ABC-type multidrug transport system fused ATPase/permease subunit
VIQDGVVVEKGSYSELLNKKDGIFARIAKGLSQNESA